MKQESYLQKKLRQLGMTQEGIGNKVSPMKKLTFRIYFPRPPYGSVEYGAAKQGDGLNFVGQLLGHRGATLKKIQQDTGTRVEVHDGRGNLNGTYPSYTDPSLHAIVYADCKEKLSHAVKLISNFLAPINGSFESFEVIPNGSALLRPKLPTQQPSNSKCVIKSKSSLNNNNANNSNNNNNANNSNVCSNLTLVSPSTTAWCEKVTSEISDSSDLSIKSNEESINEKNNSHIVEKIPNEKSLDYASKSAKIKKSEATKSLQTSKDINTSSDYNISQTEMCDSFTSANSSSSSSTSSLKEANISSSINNKIPFQHYNTNNNINNADFSTHTSSNSQDKLKGIREWNAWGNNSHDSYNQFTSKTQNLVSEIISRSRLLKQKSELPLSSTSVTKSQSYVSREGAIRPWSSEKKILTCGNDEKSFMTSTTSLFETNTENKNFKTKDFFLDDYYVGTGLNIGNGAVIDNFYKPPDVYTELIGGNDIEQSNIENSRLYSIYNLRS